MIFCGDTVYPFDFFDKKLFSNIDKEFLNKPKILNLESLILDSQKRKTTKGIALNSSKYLIDFLHFLNVEAVSLANNHITDFEISIDMQKRYLLEYGIKSFGAGDNLESASKYFKYIENNKEYYVFSFGWDVIGCKYSTLDKKGVNPMDFLYIFELLEKNNKSLILIFHNNYEFELYPQPAHRKLFFDLIERFDIKAIFCHHPHIVGGCEIYKSVPIFYSLGNFYLPEVNYNGYNLKYDDNAKEGLCVEFDENIENIYLHWTYKDDNNILSITNIEKLTKSNKIQELTPFYGFNHKEYIDWFIKNRKKKKLLPIYKNYNNKIENIINNFIVKSRQKFIDTLVNLRIK